MTDPVAIVNELRSRSLDGDEFAQRTRALIYSLESELGLARDEVERLQRTMTAERDYWQDHCKAGELREEDLRAERDELIAQFDRTAQILTLPERLRLDMLEGLADHNVELEQERNEALGELETIRRAGDYLADAIGERNEAEAALAKAREQLANCDTRIHTLCDQRNEARALVEKMVPKVVEAAVYAEHPDELGEELCAILKLDAERMFEEGDEYEWSLPWESEDV